MMIMDLLSAFNQTEIRQISALSIINQNTLMQSFMGVGMTELNPLKWQEIFSQLVEEGHYDVGSVNYYHLTSILEDLYVENQELKSRVETLEKDMELIKSYAWEK